MKKILLVSFTFFIAAAFLVSCAKKDKTAPVITVIGANPATVMLNDTSWHDPGATAADNEDGNITSTILVNNKVNVNKKGSYEVTYTAADAAGNQAQAIRKVNVVNSAESFAGTYSVHNIRINPDGTNTESDFVDYVVSSDTLNGAIRFTKFGYYSDGFVTAIITGHSLAIPQQDILCGDPPATRRFVGSGSADTLQILVNYTEITGGQTYTGSGSYSRAAR